MPLLIFVAEKLSDSLGIAPEGSRRLVFAGLMLPWVFGLGFWEWKTGTYALKQNQPQ